MTTNLNRLPTDLPIPQDDGSTNHLKGMKLPNVSLTATNGKTIDLGDIKGKLVIYYYPMTGHHQETQQPQLILSVGGFFNVFFVGGNGLVSKYLLGFIQRKLVGDLTQPHLL